MYLSLSLPLPSLEIAVLLVTLPLINQCLKPCNLSPQRMELRGLEGLGMGGGFGFRSGDGRFPRRPVAPSNPDNAKPRRLGLGEAPPTLRL